MFMFGSNIEDTKLLETVEKLIASQKKVNNENEKTKTYSLFQILRHAELRKRLLLGCTVALVQTVVFTSKICLWL